MDKISNLDKLKEKYSKLETEYGLPSFLKLNEEFEIEKAVDGETDFILRTIRECIINKFFNYLRFVESIINPSNSPLFVFAITKMIGNKEREKLVEVYKKISKIELDVIELDLFYSEQKEADSIKRHFSMWQEVKSDLLSIIEVIKKNWDSKEVDNGKGYFG